MRIDQALTPAVKGTGEGVQAAKQAELNQGEQVEAKVLFSRDGAVHLKTGDGSLIKARIEGNIVLEEGARVLLTVLENNGGSIVLSVGREAGYPADPNISGEISVPAADGQAALLAARLEYLRLPVTERNIYMMQEIIDLSPGISLDKAAFIAANLDAEITPALIDAFEALTEGKVKSADMLADISKAVLSEGSARVVPEEMSIPGTGNLTKPEGNPETAGAAVLPGEAPGDAEVQDVAAKATGKPAAQTEPAVVGAGAGDYAEADVSIKGAGTGEVVPLRGNAALHASGEQAAVTGAEAPESTVFSPADRDSILSMLTKMPAFANLPEKNVNGTLDIIINTLRDIGNINIEENPDYQEKMAEFVDNLFAKLDEGGKDRSGQLKKAREELEIRLSLFKDAVEGSGLASKTALAGQTQRLIDHVRLTNSIDQFVYAQIPVILNNEQRTAELYVFKQNKGQKKIDPENVNILLALDMTFMGHIESFIGVRGKDVSLNVTVDSPAAGEFIGQNTAGLHRLLSESGFKLAGLKVRQGGERTTADKALLSLFEYEKRLKRGFDLSI
ncbi:MAG: flagellar hook-length control protein FliK [Oscillospiraceae bacterium]|jgi:hypothetical protein|nr:flagellar hook-length control protein FliK [Oscillospiraceae bacterium]